MQANNKETKKGIGKKFQGKINITMTIVWKNDTNDDTTHATDNTNNQNSKLYNFIITNKTFTTRYRK